MTRSLTLHIGNHKTGTTSIQSALSKADDPRIFNDPLDERHRKKLKSWYGNSWIVKNNSRPDASAWFHKDFADALKAHNPDGDVIFSAEDMSWVFNHRVLARFSRSLRAEFDQFRIVVYLRRQDRNAISLYQQGINSKRSHIKVFMNSNAVTLPHRQRHYDLYFNYNLKLRKWAYAFGKDAIEAFVFEDVIASTSIVPHFAQFTGLELVNEQLHLRKSMPKSLQLLKHKLHALDLELDLPEHMEYLLDKEQKALPPKQQAQDFYQAYKESNINLNQWLKINERPAIFAEDFSIYPENGSETWDEESADDVVASLILLLAETKYYNQEAEQELKTLQNRLRALET